MIPFPFAKMKMPRNLCEPFGTLTNKLSPLLSELRVPASVSRQRPHSLTQLRTHLTRVQEWAPHESHNKVCSLAENFNKVF